MSWITAAALLPPMAVQVAREGLQTATATMRKALPSSGSGTPSWIPVCRPQMPFIVPVESESLADLTR